MGARTPTTCTPSTGAQLGWVRKSELLETPLPDLYQLSAARIHTENAPRGATKRGQRCRLCRNAQKPTPASETRFGELSWTVSMGHADA